jgi:NAD(P)-dependent dehydrogenase (short-subunit alcohol dehydrogenase family)
MAMNDKTVVVTGANQGIGRVTAKELARMGARVALVCRNAEKGQAVVREIEAAGGKAELVVADLSIQDEVRKAGRELREKLETIDVLVNNAGVLVTERRVTKDGIEETLALNHLAYFLLTHELLEPLTKAKSARIVNVSSRAHLRAKPNLDDIQFSRGYSMITAYSHSKLLNVLFTYELARRLEGTNVTANCLHPGVIASGFAQTYGGFVATLAKLARPFLMTTEEGAKTQIYLASSPEVAGVTGRYFDRCKAVRSSSASYDVDTQTRLWEISEKLVFVRDKSLWGTYAKA